VRTVPPPIIANSVSLTRTGKASEAPTTLAPNKAKNTPGPTRLSTTVTWPGSLTSAELSPGSTTALNSR